MDIELLVLAAALIYSLANLVKMAQAGQIKPAVTLLFTYLLAVGVAAVIVRTSYASGYHVGDVRLDLLNQWDQILLAFQLAAGANVLYDIIPKNTPTLGEKEPVIEATGVRRN